MINHRKFLLTATFIASIAMAIALPIKTFACCSCAVSAGAASAASWAITLDVFEAQMEAEVEAHKVWVQEVWWNDNFLQALKGLAATETAAKAQISANETKAAEAASEARNSRAKAMEMAQNTLDFMPSEQISDQMENGTIHAQVDLTGTAFGQALANSSKPPKDPTGRSMDTAIKENGGITAIVAPMKDSAECDPISPASSPDCNTAILSIALTAIPERGPIDSIFVDSQNIQQLLAAEFKANYARDTIAKNIAEKFDQNGEGSLYEKKAAAADRGTDPRVLTGLSGMSDIEMKRAEYVAAADKARADLKKLESALDRELGLAIMLTKKIQDNQNAGIGLMPNMGTSPTQVTLSNGGNSNVIASNMKAVGQ